MDIKNFNERLKDKFKDHSLNLANLPRRDRKCVAIYNAWAGSDNYILDLGCGTGVMAKMFKAHNNRVIGLDISSQAVEEANQGGIEALVCDIEKVFPFEDNTFDRVNCVSVIEHLLEPEKTVKEVFRVLKKGGQAIFQTPNCAFWRQRFMLLFFGKDVNVEGYPWEELYPWNQYHIRFFNFRTLKELLIKSGFKILETRGSFAAFPGAIAGYFPKIIRYPLALLDIITFGFDFLADIYPPFFSAGILLRVEKP